MNSSEKEKFGIESTPEQPPLDRREIFSRLALMDQKLEWELDESVIEDLQGADDNDLLGNLMTFALEHDIDPDEFFQLLGIDTTQAVENDVDTE
jgi:hypothetical protein